MNKKMIGIGLITFLYLINNSLSYIIITHPTAVPRPGPMTDKEFCEQVISEFSIVCKWGESIQQCAKRELNSDSYIRFIDVCIDNGEKISTTTTTIPSTTTTELSTRNPSKLPCKTIKLNILPYYSLLSSILVLLSFFVLLYITTKTSNLFIGIITGTLVFIFGMFCILFPPFIIVPLIAIIYEIKIKQRNQKHSFKNMPEYFKNKKKR